MPKVRKQFILDDLKIKKVKKILHASTDTEAIDQALNQIISDEEIVKIHKKMAGKLKIKNMDQSRLK